MRISWSLADIPSMSLDQYVLSLVTVLLAYGLFRAVRRRHNVPLPPGPPSDPLIGHLRLLLRPIEETTYYQWHKQHGDVVCLNVFGQPLVLLNNEQAAKDLLDKRGIIYSDRPYFPTHEMVGWKDLLAFIPYGNEFHKTRKLFQEALSPKSVLVFREMQLHQAHVLLKSLLSSPGQFSTHVKRFASAVISEIAYGHRVENDDDPYLQLSEDINQVLAGAGNPIAAVNFFPLLRYLPAWFPGATIIRHCKNSRSTIRSAMDTPFSDVQRRMAAGSAKVSFLSMELETLSRTKNDNMNEQERLKASALQFYAGGSETTWATIENFLLTLLLHPRVQKRAQKEIDQVLGQKKLPDFGDREALPYVECVMQESMRWHPAVPLGVPHRVMADDIYHGMFIPKGATVVANTRCMTMDSSVHNDPQAFYPERYLPQTEGNGEPFPGSIFGFGRRVCPGRHLAEASVWIVISTFLATFEILPVKDGLENEVTPKPEFQTSLSSRPKPFECVIRPRSQKTQALVERL